MPPKKKPPSLALLRALKLVGQKPAAETEPIIEEEQEDEDSQFAASANALLLEQTDTTDNLDEE